MASNGKGVDVRGEVVDLLLEKIASDRNPSVTMMKWSRSCSRRMTCRHMWRS
jgi:hypothetical protein